ncbi:MAG: tetratricopeptide repeat protein [Myxococcota bacterium]|jgi:tetratricopeptide (TPR) repeat protein|nr:tetratricopeptide repeat protein [Myxococcota bacterium]
MNQPPSRISADVFNHRKAMLVALLASCVVVALACDAPPTLDEIKATQNAGAAARTVVPLRNMIDGGERTSEIFFLYGVALSATGERDAAMWPLRKAMEDPEWIVPAGLQMARDALRTGNFDLSIAASTRVLEHEADNTKALVLRARAQTETRRDIELALADTEAALEIDPDLHPARVSRVVALLALERVEEAAEALEEIETLAYEADPDQPDSARFCGARASFAKEKGEQELADERYTSCLERYPASEILVDDAIKFYESLGQGDRVREILTAALEAAPTVRDFRVGLAMRQAGIGMVEEAEATLREATESENRNHAANAWLDLSGFLLDRERIDEGVDAIASAIALITNPAPELRFRYADALIAAERYDEALAETENMRVAAHQNLARGRVLVAREQWSEALAALDAGLAEWPENAVARYYAAVAAENLGDFDRAVEDFRYSIRSSPVLTDARVRLAKLHHAEGQHEAAIAILRHDIANHPPTADMAELELLILSSVGGRSVVPQHLARVVNRADNVARAISALVEGLRVRNGPQEALDYLISTQADVLDPMYGRLLRDKVGLLANVDRLEEATTLGRSAVEVQPESSPAHAALGLALLLAEKNDESKAAFDRALELDPNNADALMGLARISDLGGDLVTAADLYLKADAAEPRDKVALEAAIDVLTRAERFDEAEKQLELLLEREPYLGPVSLRLVELRVARGATQDPRTRVLAQHAMRFGGAGPAAEKVLAAN